MDKVPMTQNGYDKLEAELHDLKHKQRPDVIEAIAEARAHGDLSENAEYHAAKERQSFIEGRIEELESVISRADVIDPAKLSGDTVKFGATVTVIDDETGDTQKYSLVGEYESDIKAGKLAINAPLARALIGKRVGDTATVRTPKGEKLYELAALAWVNVA